MKSLVYLAICLALNVGVAALSQGKHTQPAVLENSSDDEDRDVIALLNKAFEEKIENLRTVAPTTITQESSIDSKKDEFNLLNELMPSYSKEKDKPTTIAISTPPKKDHEDGMADKVQLYKNWLETRIEKSTILEPARMETTKKTTIDKPTEKDSKKTKKTSTVELTTEATKETSGKEMMFDEFTKTYEDTAYQKQEFEEWLNSKDDSPIAQATIETEKTSTIKPTTEVTKQTSGEEMSLDEFKKDHEDPAHLKQEFKEWLNSKEKPPTAQPTTKDEKETEKSSTVKPTTADKKGREKTAKVQSAAATTENRDQTALTSNEHKLEEPESSSADSRFAPIGWIHQGRIHFPIFFMVAITLIILLSFAYYNRKKIVSFVKRDGTNAHRGPFYMLRELREEESMPFMDKSSQLYFIA